MMSLLRLRKKINHPPDVSYTCLLWFFPAKCLMWEFHLANKWYLLPWDGVNDILASLKQTSQRRMEILLEESVPRKLKTEKHIVRLKLELAYNNSCWGRVDKAALRVQSHSEKTATDNHFKLPIISLLNDWILPLTVLSTWRSKHSNCISHE